VLGRLAVYAPANLWPELRERLAEEVAQIKWATSPTRELHGRGDRREVVRDRRRRSTRLDARQFEVLVGGGVHDDEGYFVEPTVIETRDPISASCATSCSGRS
jgi:1-pyrroline-5-carboxylate dehydrogenase